MAAEIEKQKLPRGARPCLFVPPHPLHFLLEEADRNGQHPPGPFALWHPIQFGQWETPSGDEVQRGDGGGVVGAQAPSCQAAEGRGCLPPGGCSCPTAAGSRKGPSTPCFTLGWQWLLVARPPFLFSVFHNPAVFIFYGCFNKVPQTGWLKTTEIYFQFWSLEVYNQGVSRVLLLLKPGGEFSFAPSHFCWFGGSLWLFSVCSCSAHLGLHGHVACFLCLCLYMAAFLQRHQSYWIGVHLT